MRVVLSYVSPRPGAGEVHVFPVHANVLFLTEARPIPDTPRTLASTSPSGSVSPKIIQKISQGATPEHRTLQSSNLARCNKTTSHPATLSLHSTLRLSHVAPCNIALSHPATFSYRTLRLKKSAFYPLNPLFPTPSRRSARSAAASQNPTSATLLACSRIYYICFSPNSRYDNLCFSSAFHLDNLCFPSIPLDITDNI